MRQRTLLWSLESCDRGIGFEGRDAAFRRLFGEDFATAEVVFRHDGGDWFGTLVKLKDGRLATYELACDGESLYEGDSLHCAVETCEGAAEHRCGTCNGSFCESHIKDHPHSEANQSAEQKKGYNSPGSARN